MFRQINISFLELWKKFFTECEITDKYSSLYATSFVKERIQPYLLADFTKKDLKNLGVQAYDDKVCGFFV